MRVCLSTTRLPVCFSILQCVNIPATNQIPWADGSVPLYGQRVTVPERTVFIQRSVHATTDGDHVYNLRIDPEKNSLRDRVLLFVSALLFVCVLLCANVLLFMSVGRGGWVGGISACVRGGG